MPRFNVARLFLRQTFGLGGEQETIEDGPNQLGTKQIFPDHCHGRKVRCHRYLRSERLCCRSADNVS